MTQPAQSLPAPPVRHVGIVGGGLIGQSWASLFAARGLQVTVQDPDPAMGAALEAFVAAAWPALRVTGIATAPAPVMPRFTTALGELAETGFIQENGPDRIETKRRIIAGIEAVVGPDVVIASSTSSLMASDIQAEAAQPERILVGHPMNPPHLVPMVELVGGRLTAPETLDRATELYLSVGRVPVRARREVMGHIANRLTSALYREAVHLVAEGIASVEDVDRAITYGPGMRWALMGPHLTYHMGGGPGGYRHYLDHLGPTQEARWHEHGMPRLTDAVKDSLVAGLQAELQGQDQDTLAARRDAALVALLTVKREHGF